MGFVFLVLLIGALIAAIFGRSAAQGFVAVLLGGAAVLIGLLVLVVAVILFTTPSTDMSHAHGGWDASSPSTSSPSTSSPSTSSPSSSYTGPSSSTGTSELIAIQRDQ